jgi:intein/homing endonuclease
MRKTKTPALIYGMGFGESEFQEQLAKSMVEVRTGKDSDKPTLTKSILNILDGGDNSNISRLAFETDPSQVNNFAGVYHAKLRLVPDSVLKRIAIQDSLVASIVRARQNHLTSFGRPRPDRFSSGFIIKPNTGTLDKLDAEGKKEFAKKVERAIKLLNTCGHTEGVQTEHQRTFAEYLGLSARSAVVCGRIATEIVYVKDATTDQDRFSHFVCTDAGTIYRATTDKSGQESIRKDAYHLLCKLTGKKLVPERWNSKEEYAWVQVIEGTPKQVFTKDEMKVYNFYPVPDVELDGYPVTPIDTVITAITTHINITTHNKLYFQSGRATRGMLILKSDDASPQMIHQIKQQFNASINGASSCLDGSAIVWTKQYGAIRIDDLESKVKGVEQIDVWTGKGWEKATAYKTGLKSLNVTTLGNGTVHKTSPNHRFLSIDSNGEICWKLQEELIEGDFVAVNKKNVSKEEVPQFNGQPIGEDFMEVMGWITGDGSIFEGRSLKLYYHQDLESWIRDRHIAVLRKYGFPAVAKEIFRDEEERETIKIKKGFKSVSDRVIWTEVNYAELVRKLLDLGFTNSKRGTEAVGKTVPAFVHTLPEVLKAAFLRGLFSADGNNHKLISPCLTVRNTILREQTRMLLMSMGIRVTFSEGKTIGTIGHPELGSKPGKSVLRIKDRNKFFDKVGFLQPHKQPRKPRGTNKDWGTSSPVARETVVKFLTQVKSKTKLPRGGNDHNVGMPRVFTRRQQMDIDSILRDEDCCSLNRLINYMQIANVDIPEWLLKYNFERVVEVEETGVEVEMFDMEVCDSFHAFVTNGAVCHNSWRMPVFGVPTDGEITWQPIDAGGGRDAEFQYLTDMNAREILTSFMMSPDELPGWSYLSRGTASQALSECVAAESRIVTSSGQIGIGDFVGHVKEREGVFWTGTDWGRGRAFRSGVKKLVETELGCGVVLRTSPDHRFRVINDNGGLDWKHQSELKVDDRVLVNKKPIEGNEELVPSFKGRRLTPEVTEVLGWMIGDGCLVADKVRTGAKLHLFYHPEVEEAEWIQQSETLSGFGLTVHQEETLLSDEEREEEKNRYGFKSIAYRRLRNTVYDTDFYRWLIDLGFSPSSRGEIGKTIPSIFHVLPIKYRQAFLRGLFSADGGKVNETGGVALTIQNGRLRDQVRQMLLGLGVRTLPCKGIKRPKDNKISFGSSDYSYKLFIKDRFAFWNLIGFIQPHKQLSKPPQRWSIDRPPMGVIKKCLIPCKESLEFKKLDKVHRDMINAMLNGKPCSYNSLASLMSMCNVAPPSWFNDYHLEPVLAIRDLEKNVEMYDVEMYDDVHAFLVEGVVTHNSNGEYKLTAARDVGIRPLLASFEDFINSELFPLIDLELSKQARISLVGLDANTPEKENTELQTSSAVYLTFDDILQKVEKEPVGKSWGGQLPLNPVFKSYLDQYFTVGEIKEHFMGIAGASKDPNWAFPMNPLYFQNQQLLQAAQQAQAQAQQPQGGPSGGAPQGGGQEQPGEGQDEPTRTNPQDDATEKQRSDQPEASQPAPKATELGKALDQAFDLMQKSENNLPPEKRRILDQHKKTVSYFVDGFKRDTYEATREILDIARQLSPKEK